MPDNKQLKSVFFATALRFQAVLPDQNQHFSSVCEFDQKPLIAKEDKAAAQARKNINKQMTAYLS